MSEPVPVSFPDDLLAEIRKTAKETHLSQQDVIRQSTRLGIPRLREQLVRAVPRPQRLSVWDALHCGRGVELEIKPLAGKVKKVVL
jgi:hypothetical protein